MRSLTLILLLLFTAGAYAAETRYVSDQLVINMRTGKGNTYKIIRTLPAGTPLEVLKDEGDYLWVRARGEEGWVLSQYVVTTPIAADRLAAAEKKAANLSAEVQSLRQQLTETQAERDRLSQTQQETAQQKNALEQRVAELEEIAADPIALRAENKNMKGRIGELEHSLTQIQRRNDELRNASQRDWFVAGAGVLGGGIILGLVLPALRRRRRESGWGDLR